jgi:hypothetical protein
MRGEKRAASNLDQIVVCGVAGGVKGLESTTEHREFVTVKQGGSIDVSGLERSMQCTC